MVGGSYSRRRYESELFRVADSWGSYNGSYVPQNQAFFLYDIEPPAAGRQRGPRVPARAAAMR